jgi:hypothetical protein
MCLEGLRKTTKNVDQDSLSPGGDLNPGPAEYEAGVPTTQLRHSVIMSSKRDIHYSVAALFLWVTTFSGFWQVTKSGSRKVGHEWIGRIP